MWCYKWTDRLDELDGSLGGVRYRAPYGANTNMHTIVQGKGKEKGEAI